MGVALSYGLGLWVGIISDLHLNKAQDARLIGTVVLFHVITENTEIPPVFSHEGSLDGCCCTERDMAKYLVLILVITSLH